MAPINMDSTKTAEEDREAIDHTFRAVFDAQVEKGVEANGSSDGELQKLKYKLGLFDRKQQAFKLRTAKVNEAQEGKADLMMLQLSHKLRNEEILVAQENEARQIRMTEIKTLKLQLDEFLKMERVRQAKEGMVQEIFEEDNERIKVELTRSIEKLTAHADKEARPGSGEVGHKRKTASYDDQPRAKKRMIETPEAEVTEVEAYDSQTISASSIPETVFVSQRTPSETVDEHAGCGDSWECWSCYFCGKPYPRLVDDKGKDVLCDCSPRVKTLWDVEGLVDEDDDLGSDDETVGRE